ncbi:hypothetical protein EYF80_002947 [Liparis tanakae]|uniref:Uncharacterized protein n=1 Tax=Liparis tanakae TaxID=230148 RepID=A0A4Z2JAD4_9TELE|nr:hypothetical protein EYF80_002947 [Liparis tanakae]
MQAAQSPIPLLLISLLCVSQLQRGHGGDFSSDTEKQSGYQEVISQTPAPEPAPEQDNSFGYKGLECRPHSAEAPVVLNEARVLNPGGPSQFLLSLNGA